LEHDLFGKPEVHPRIKSEGRLFPDHALKLRNGADHSFNIFRTRQAVIAVFHQCEHDIV
jgi:hypothetical protein